MINRRLQSHLFICETDRAATRPATGFVTDAVWLGERDLTPSPLPKLVLSLSKDRKGVFFPPRSGRARVGFYCFMYKHMNFERSKCRVLQQFGFVSLRSTQ